MVAIAAFALTIVGGYLLIRAYSAKKNAVGAAASNVQQTAPSIAALYAEVPLRILAIIANCCLVAFYALEHVWIPLVLQSIALPLNNDSINLPYPPRRTVLLLLKTRQAKPTRGAKSK